MKSGTLAPCLACFISKVKPTFIRQTEAPHQKLIQNPYL